MEAEPHGPVERRDHTGQPTRPHADWLPDGGCKRVVTHAGREMRLPARHELPSYVLPDATCLAALAAPRDPILSRPGTLLPLSPGMSCYVVQQGTVLYICNSNLSIGRLPCCFRMKPAKNTNEVVPSRVPPLAQPSAVPLQGSTSGHAHLRV